MHIVEYRLLQIVGNFIANGQITRSEFRELKESHRFLMDRAWKQANLENQSFAAYLSEDTEWQHEICAKIDKLNEV